MHELSDACFVFGHAPAGAVGWFLGASAVGAEGVLIRVRLIFREDFSREEYKPVAVRCFWGWFCVFRCGG